MTKTCCFFGHREVTHNIRGKLIEIIDNLITEKDVKEFYVGNQGQFDSMVYSVVQSSTTQSDRTAFSYEPNQNRTPDIYRRKS